MNTTRKIALILISILYAVFLFYVYSFKPSISVDESFAKKAFVIYFLATMVVVLVAADYFLIQRESLAFWRKIALSISRGLALLCIVLLLFKREYISRAIVLIAILSFFHSGTIFAICGKVDEILELKFREFLALAAGNLAVFLILFGVAEGGSRLIVGSGVLDRRQDPAKPVPDAWFRFHPWIMWKSDPDLNARFDLYNWHSKTFSPAQVVTNNLGFRTDRDYFPGGKLKRENPAEKIVILAGGSVAAGVGATSNANQLSERLEVLLNEAGRGTRYRVFNFAQGSWVAYQNFLAMDLFAHDWKPDYVVHMDGRNDGWVACRSEQGAYNPNYTAGFRSYIDGNFYKNRKPGFFRSETENTLLKYSAFYRLITGEEAVEPHQAPTITWECADGALDFYILALQSVRRYCSGSCRMVVATQPLVDFFSKFSEACGPGKECSNRLAPAERQELSRRNAGRPISEVPYSDFLAYFYSELIDRSASFARAENVTYQDLGIFMPVQMEDRKRNFSDHCHLTDAGQSEYAGYLRDLILSAP